MYGATTPRPTTTTTNIYGRNRSYIYTYILIYRSYTYNLYLESHPPSHQERWKVVSCLKNTYNMPIRPHEILIEAVWLVKRWIQDSKISCVCCKEKWNKFNGAFFQILLQTYEFWTQIWKFIFLLQFL